MAMQSALRMTTKVLPGNKIELEIPPGSEGQEVEVFVVLPATVPPTTFSLSPQNVSAALDEMAIDPDIQSELAAIDAEFAVALLDGLNPE
jgi:hypothetical protein